MPPNATETWHKINIVATNRSIMLGQKKNYFSQRQAKENFGKK
jgi:hypothetical protein